MFKNNSLNNKNYYELTKLSVELGIDSGPIWPSGSADADHNYLMF